MTDEEVKGQFDAYRQENAAEHEETRRHITASFEGLNVEIRLIGEQISLFEQKLDSLFAAQSDRWERFFAELHALIKFAQAGRDRPAKRRRWSSKPRVLASPHRALE